jgi:hypothetical protein
MSIDRHLRISRFYDERGHIIRHKDIFQILRAFLERIKARFMNRSYLPILNFPTLDVLQKYVNNDVDVIEWGSGRATAFLAKICRTIHSVEDHPDWKIETMRLLQHFGIKNFTLDQVEFGDIENYVNEPLKYVNEEKSDLVFIIDGSYRNACAQQVVQMCRDRDVILLDDSDKNWSILDSDRLNFDDPSNIRSAYVVLLSSLAKRGFASVSVRGFSPTHLYVKEATFFFHPMNTRFTRSLKGNAAI